MSRFAKLSSVLLPFAASSKTSASSLQGAGMLHLRELRVLRCVVCLERQRECGKIGLLLY